MNLTIDRRGYVFLKKKLFINKENKCCNTDRFRYGKPVLVYFVSSPVQYVYNEIQILDIDFAPPPSLSPTLPSESSTGDTQEDGKRKKTC